MNSLSDNSDTVKVYRAEWDAACDEWRALYAEWAASGEPWSTTFNAKLLTIRATADAACEKWSAAVLASAPPELNIVSVLR